MSLKILMVDDEPDAEILFRQNFRREIRKGVYDFFFAQSGGDALTLLEGMELPDVLALLSDINMPGMSGVELLGEVKERWPELPVMMITAYADPGTAACVKQKGAQDLVTKPVDFDFLKQQLEQMSAGARG
ncbi:response regulator [Rhodobacteraceae bacterium D3-12]|nr:response regulator [Rhodobacteraceae bacterium D3-12]